MRLRVALICLCAAGIGGRTILASDIAQTEPKASASAPDSRNAWRRPGQNGGVVGGVVSPPKSKLPSTGKPPSVWTLDERLSIRCNRALAQARRGERDGGVQSFGLSVPSGGRTLDIISGKSHPELFLPHELFEIFVKGVLDPNGRHFYSIVTKQAGLPDVFLTQIEALSRGYIKDIQEKRGLQSDRSAVGHALRLADSVRFESKLCHDRALALSAARSHFGAAFDQFLYEQVAPGLTANLDEYSDERVLRWREGGCQ